MSAQTAAHHSRILLLAVLGMMLGAIHPASADPAVADLNAKVDIRGGDANDHGFGTAGVGATLPLGPYFGTQIDAALSDSGGRIAKGGDAQFFWRDPSRGMIGANVERAWRDGQYFDRFGPEAEYYYGQWTALGQVGYQNGIIGRGVYAKLGADWYINDNLMVGPGFEDSAGRYTGSGNVEWQPGSMKEVPGLSLFATAGAGDHALLFVGVRYYFGADGTLKWRHRNEDPSNNIAIDMPNNLSQHAPNGSTGGDGGGGGGGG